MTHPRSAPSRASWLLFALGLLLGLLAVLLFVTACLIGASASGWGYVLGGLLLSVGLLTKRWRRWRGLTRAGLGLLLLVIGARLLLTERRDLRTHRLPDGGSRWVNRLVEERDGTLLAAHALLRSGRIPRADARDCEKAIASWLLDRER